jgi:NADH-quinone oxidoreductase subunit J
MDLFFYILSCCCLACTTLVIGIRNPIHSILLLIAVFATGSLLLFMLNVEFFGIIFLVVYVGAIAVLFLFIVMMLDIKVINTAQKLKDFFSYRNLITVLVLILVLMTVNDDVINLSAFNINEVVIGADEYTNYSKILEYKSHLQVLGIAIYDQYTMPFLLCGFILFIAMVGAIVVTLEDENLKSVKQQNPVNQAFRTADTSIFNFKIYNKHILNKK